jgi:protease I
MSRKILIITGDAGESYETLYAIHRFKEAEWEPVVAAPSRRRLHLVIHDFEPGWDTYVERQGYQVVADLTFEEVRVEDYEAVLVIGGRAPEYLRNDTRVLDIVRAFHEQDRWVFAICHGIQVLVTAGLAKGRNITAYEHVRAEVEAVGGHYTLEKQAVRDGKIVTGQTWQSHPEFYREVFACVGGLEAVGAD